MRDDALSPVIAAMLILAVVVTAFSIYHAQVLPEMKEEAEIAHIQEVEAAFLAMSADISYTVGEKRDLLLKETVPLGGGDIITDPLRSGASLSVTPADGWLLDVTLKNNEIAVYSANSSLCRIAFIPSGNFWEDQGYAWDGGVLNVTAGSRETPLEFVTMTQARAGTGDLARLFGTVSGQDSTTNTTYQVVTNVRLEGSKIVYDNETIIIQGNDQGNCSALAIDLAGVLPGKDRFIGGNGIATISIAAATGERTYDANTVTFLVSNETMSLNTTALWEKIRQSLQDINDRYQNAEAIFNEEATAPDGTSCREAVLSFYNGTMPQELPVLLRESRVRISVC